MAKIIIVEDDPMISEIYQKKFAESGYDVLSAESGDQVLALAKKEKVDAILLDLIMPKMDGFEIIKSLRSGHYDKNIKIIVFSNLSQREDQDKATKLGADGFMVKSDYTPSTLVKEVTRLLNQGAEEKKNLAIQSGKKEAVPAGSAKRVLLVEDENIFIEMFGEKLRQDGYAVEAAQNGAWGLKKAMENNFDIFIIDMVMPAMTGEEIIQKLKLEEKTKNIPIIVLSASVDDETRKRVSQLGINEFFVKTQIVPSELSKKVEELLK